MNNTQLLDLRVRSVREEAEGIHSYELVSHQAQPLPRFTAGAHIALHLPCGLVRCYSLSNPPHDDRRYVITVSLDAASRGGSRYMHREVRVGDVLQAEQPRNNFELHEEALHSTFIAGGIGITPIRSMIARLSALNKPWELHYCARNAPAAAFMEEMRAYPNVHFYFDQTERPNRLQIEALLAAQKDATHIYCCGPQPMLDAFLTHGQALAQERIHFERFSADIDPASLEGGYRVRLARSGRILTIPTGATILQTLIEAGLSPVHSCAQGVCGTCETTVLAGRPDHRDHVLTQSEKDSGQSMMICCSGSLDDELVLDL